MAVVPVNDSLRAAGMVAGGGVAGFVLLIGWRVYNDVRMAWVVVLSLLAVVVLLALALVLFLARQAMDSRIILVARAQEDRLLSARVARTWPDGGPGAGGRGDNGFLGQLLAGQAGHDVIDTGLSWSAKPEFVDTQGGLGE